MHRQTIVSQEGPVSELPKISIVTSHLVWHKEVSMTTDQEIWSVSLTFWHHKNIGVSLIRDFTLVCQGHLMVSIFWIERSGKLIGGLASHMKFSGAITVYRQVNYLPSALKAFVYSPECPVCRNGYNAGLNFMGNKCFHTFSYNSNLNSMLILIMWEPWLCIWNINQK